MRAAMSILGLYNYDSSIFDGMAIPDGVDKENAVNCILMELAELEVIYPSWDTMKFAITQWSNAQLPSWERINLALSADYNPLENYDRKEDWMDNAKANGNYNNKVAGFNFADGQTDQNSSTQNTNSDNVHSGRIHGNIGVTTSPQMIIGETDMRRKYNMVNIIVEEFKQRFCLMVY